MYNNEEKTCVGNCSRRYHDARAGRARCENYQHHDARNGYVVPMILFASFNTIAGTLFRICRVATPTKAICIIKSGYFSRD